jgi:hypothetical protein
MFAIWKQSDAITEGNLNKRKVSRYTCLDIGLNIHMTSNRKQGSARHQILEYTEQACAYFKYGGARAHVLCSVWGFSTEKKLILTVGAVGEYVRKAMSRKI